MVGFNTLDKLFRGSHADRGATVNLISSQHREYSYLIYSFQKTSLKTSSQNSVDPIHGTCVDSVSPFKRIKTTKKQELAATTATLTVAPPIVPKKLSTFTTWTPEFFIQDVVEVVHDAGHDAHHDSTHDAMLEPPSTPVVTDDSMLNSRTVLTLCFLGFILPLGLTHPAGSILL